MKIREMFAEDINRPINGVIKVDQDSEDVTRQEVQEYVITKELKKHFISFFDFYSESFINPTYDIGVWISGFFGSGKSHFLKMLSYLLKNKRVNGVPTVEMFRSKFADDPATFMLIDNSTRYDTETILFNIDIEGSITKDNTAVLRVFAKMFYKHLGFYGENLKLALLEQYIDQQGKTEEFRRVYEQKKGKPWLEQRKAFAFNGKIIIPTLMEVLDMSEEDARNWYQDKSSEEYSIASLVEDIKVYVDSKPKNFRLLFMVDEVGQYVGTNTDMLLNLQSLTEKLGSECQGKVWIVCTGQEAIDEIIKVREDEFSRIQARFKTRLSLSSSSVDEVIQKRVLKKKPEYEKRLQEVYDTNDSGLRNLYSFKNAKPDIKGFEGPQEFSDNFPFVPYQFIVMQNVFTEIRTHGNSGKHLSGGERSMLSGFQEAAQKVQERDEFALVPFYRFYDTVHTFLDSTIRRVIERCQNAADNNDGLEQCDVDLLKLLYLIRYVNDIPATLDNIVIMMADDIRMDTAAMREKMRGSLDRLLRQNYIGRNGEEYNFLTNEEQDVAKEIHNTNVDTSAIVEKLGRMIFEDIYTTKKYRYGRNDFEFDKMVDNITVGTVTGGMRLCVLTVATDPIEKNEMHLMEQSDGQAIVVLPETKYYESVENAMKIRKYVKQRNVSQLTSSMQAIIRDWQSEADNYEKAAMDELEKAIKNADFYVDKEHLIIKGTGAKSKIDQALEYLVAHVYSDLELITKNIDSDDEIYQILRNEEIMISGMKQNRDAAAKMEEYLEIQENLSLPTSMADVQNKFQGKPNGWREIDIAAVAAKLIADQKVTIKYGATIIQPDNPKLPDMLRKKNETGKTNISLRKLNSAADIREARDFLREYFDVMDVPEDEDGLIKFIIESFGEQKDHYAELENRHSGHKYPDHALVSNAIKLINDILSQQKDNIALVKEILKRRDDLEDNKEKMQRVENFFKSQVKLFDTAVKLEADLQHELDYLSSEPEANEALNQIRLICMVQPGEKFNYKRIPELNGLISKVHEGHDRLLDAKREDLLEDVRQCREAIHMMDNGDNSLNNIVSTADSYYTEKEQSIKELNSLALLDGLTQQMAQYKDTTLKRIEAIKHPKVVPTHNDINKSAPKKVYKSLNRSIVFPAKKLESEDDIKNYVEQMQDTLLQYLENYGGIDLK